MKITEKLKILLITVIGLITIGSVQSQELTDRHRILNFTVSYESAEIQEKTKTELYNLVIRADNTYIPNAIRIYIRIIDPTTGKNILVKTVEKEVFKGELLNYDVAFKMAELYENEVRLNLGPFEKGEYEVFLKIKDEKGNMYFDRKKIILYGSNTQTLMSD